jgi:integrase
MGTVRKHGDGWQGIVRRKGHKPVYETFPLKKQADAWVAQREAEIVSGRLGILPKHTLGEALKRFRLEKAPKRRGGRWETNRLLLLEADPIAKVALDKLDSSHLSELRDRELSRSTRAGKPVQGTTVRRIFSLLSSVFRACREWKWLVHNPFLDFDRPPPKKGRRRGIRQEEIDGIVAALGFDEAPPRTFAQQTAIEFLLEIETAMRDGELLTIGWPQVFPKRVHLEKTKNGDERDVALSQRARQLLGYMRGIDPERVFTVDSATRDVLFRDARKRAGLGGFTFHDGRGEAITRLSKKIEILDLAEMVGHRDLNSLRHYYRSDADAVADKLDFLPSLEPDHDLGGDVARVAAALLADADRLREIGLRRDVVHHVVALVFGIGRDLVEAPQLTPTERNEP